MPVKVLGRGTVVPQGGLEEGDAETRAARAALASARIEPSTIDTVVAASPELAAKVAAMLGAPHASAVGCAGRDGTTIEVAAALAENVAGRMVLAVETVTAGRGGNEMVGGVAAVVTKAQPVAPGTTKIQMQTVEDEEEPVVSWRPTPTSGR